MCHYRGRKTALKWMIWPCCVEGKKMFRWTNQQSFTNRRSLPQQECDLVQSRLEVINQFWEAIRGTNIYFIVVLYICKLSCEAVELCRTWSQICPLRRRVWYGSNRLPHYKNNLVSVHLRQPTTSNKETLTNMNHFSGYIFNNVIWKSRQTPNLHCYWWVCRMAYRHTHT